MTAQPNPQWRELDSLSPAEILKVIRERALELGTVEIYQLLNHVAVALGSSWHQPDAFTRQGRVIQERYAARIKRALDILTRDGTLVKTGMGHGKGPGGGYVARGQVKWYTPGAFRAAEQEVLAKRRLKEEADRHWQQIGKRLYDLTGVVLSNRHTLEPDQWDHLLRKMEADEHELRACAADHEPRQR